MLACVAFERFWSRKSTQRLFGPPPSGRFGGGGSSLGRKLLRLAAASIRVLSTLKCSSLSKRRRSACDTTVLVDFQITTATGTAERDVVPHLIDDARARGFHPTTLGADKGL